MRQIMPWVIHFCTAMLRLSVVFAIIMTGFVILSSLMRYGAGAPFAFTEELVGLLLTTLVFLGLPYCTLSSRHISVTIVLELMPPRAQKALVRLANVITAVFFLWFGFVSFGNAQTAIELNAQTVGSRLLLWPWAAVLPLSCGLAALSAVIRALVPLSLNDDDKIIGSGV